MSDAVRQNDVSRFANEACACSFNLGLMRYARLLQVLILLSKPLPKAVNSDLNLNLRLPASFQVVYLFSLRRWSS